MTEKKYLDDQGLETLVALLKEYISSSSNLIVQQYDSLYKFPNVGKESVLYIDKETNRSYRWDDTNLKYYFVGSDYEEIEVIDGGKSY